MDEEANVSKPNVPKKKKRRFLSALLVLLCLLAISLLLYNGIIWPNTLFIAPYHMQGIDVSSYQGQIDWKRVAQTDAYSFAFIKATEGTTYQDAYFQANWRGSKEHGLLRGAYHYYIVSIPGIDQANNYISMVPKEAGMLPPVLDLETSGQDQQATLHEVSVFLNRLEQYYGMKPIIYTDHNRYEEYIRGNLEQYPIWISDVLIPVQWSSIPNWTFWQYNSRGHVPGIVGFVDMNAFHGTKDQLNNLVLTQG